MAEKELIHIYTDGACSPNPGTGGWGAILIAPNRKGHQKELSGAEANTTNNRMELTAALQALQALKKPCLVQLHTDSQYLRNAFTKGWLRKWQANGWRTAAQKPVLNKDLWVELVRLAQFHDIHWVWVRGHADNPLNNRCDEMAVTARERLAAGRG